MGLDSAPTWSPRALTEINDWINDWRCFLQEINDWLPLVECLLAYIIIGLEKNFRSADRLVGHDTMNLPLCRYKRFSKTGMGLGVGLRANMVAARAE